MNENTKKYLITRVILAVVTVLAAVTIVNLFLPPIVKALAVDFSKGQQIGGDMEWMNQANAMSENFRSLVLLLVSFMIPYAALTAARKFDLRVIYATDNIMTNKLNFKFWTFYTGVVILCSLVSPILLVISPIFGLLLYSYNDYKLNHNYFIQ